MKSDARKQGDIDTSFGTDGTFVLKAEGYVLEPGASEPLRALARTDDGKIMLAMGCREPTSQHWQYALARLTPAGQFDPSFGEQGVVIHPPLPGETLQAAQALPVSGGATVLVLRSQLSDKWQLTRRTETGDLDQSFGVDGYVNLDDIHPEIEPDVVKGFVIHAEDEGFFFVGTTKTPDKHIGGIVFRFDASGRLNPAFAGNGYALIDLPFGTSGRITDAILQDDGKVVLSTATVAGNGRIVRLLPTGKPDPGFGTDGAFVVEGDSADRNEIERLAWSVESGLWAAGSVMTRTPKAGLLLRLDDKGRIPVGFNGGKLLEIDYEGLGSQGGMAFPMHIEASAGGVRVVGRADNDRTEIRRVIVGSHDLSGALDVSFGDRDRKSVV